MTYQGTAILEPNLRHKSRTTVHPKAARLRVTLARAKSTGLDEFMKRDVYITLGEPPLEEEPAEESSSVVPDGSDADTSGTPKPSEQDLAINVTIAEEDLVAVPAPGESEAYWKQVRGDRSAGTGAGRYVRFERAPSGETVRVRFKLYESGVAQLIQIEGDRDLGISMKPGFKPSFMPIRSLVRRLT